MKSKKTDYQLQIINRIKCLRHEHNLSQSKICDIIGMSSYGQIGNIESPKFVHKYTLKQIYLIADYLDYPIEKLFLTDDEIKNETPEVIKTLILRLVEYEN